MAVGFSASGQHYQALTGLPASTYTFTAWVRPAGVGTRNRAVFWFRQSSNESFSGVSIRDNPSNLQLIDGATYGFSGVGQLAASADTWYQVAAVVNGADATFYRSALGDPLTSATVANFTPAATPNQLWLGTDPFGGWWEGRIAAVKVWMAALTAGEVETELSQYAPRRTADLLRWHPFLVAETTDYSGNGNTLTGGTGATTEDGPPIPWASAIPLVVIPEAESVTGSLAAALPSLAATAGGEVTATGSLDCGLPALTASTTGVVEVAGTLSAALPALAEGLQGAVSAEALLDATVPALTAGLSGHVADPPEGVLSATLPALQATFTGASEVVESDIEGIVGAPRTGWPVGAPYL